MGVIRDLEKGHFAVAMPEAEPIGFVALKQFVPLPLVQGEEIWLANQIGRLSVCIDV